VDMLEGRDRKDSTRISNKDSVESPSGNAGMIDK
jgi:hypothetical protein